MLENNTTYYWCAKAYDGIKWSDNWSEVFSFTYDTLALTVSISSSESNPTNSSPFSVTITFSESVTGFAIGDITVGNGTASNFNAIGNPVFTADITPTAGGTVTVDVDAGVANDALTGVKNNNAASQFSITYDNSAPTVAITSSESTLTAISPFSVTITFSEEVTDFTVEDITVGNGDASNLQTSDDTVFTADITPSEDPVDVTVDIDSGVCTDAAGNNNTAAGQFSIWYDTSALTVSISSSESDPTNSSPFTVIITFSEAVTGFVVGDITVGNGSASNFQTSDNIVFTVDITPSEGGIVTVDVAAGVANDSLTGLKSNTAASQFSITYIVLAKWGTAIWGQSRWNP